MAASTIAYAQVDDWNPPLPGPMDGGSGGSGSSGGGGGGAVYSPEPFKPYTVNVTSSDNQGTGTMDVKDYYLATVEAGRSIPAGSGNASVRLTSDLGSVPTKISLDILPLDVNMISFPFDLSPIMAFNLTRSANNGGDWPMKAGTVHMLLRIPLETFGGRDMNATFYLLKDDGTQLIAYDAVPAIEQGMALFDVPLYYETNSPSASGTFALAGPRARAAVEATVSPTPTPVPATPTPKSGSEATLILLMAALGITGVFLGRNRKQ